MKIALILLTVAVAVNGGVKEAQDFFRDVYPYSYYVQAREGQNTGLDYTQVPPCHISVQGCGDSSPEQIELDRQNSGRVFTDAELLRIWGPSRKAPGTPSIQQLRKDQNWGELENPYRK